MANNLKEVLDASYIILLILIVYIFYYRKQRQSELSKIDTNDDGIISDKEVIEYYRKKMKKGKTFDDLVRTFIMGGFRGFLMGFILNGLDGAAMMAVVLGSVNVLMYEVENIS